MFEWTNLTPLQPISSSLFSSKGIDVLLKRDDLIDSEISGNKWRKLKYNLIEAKNQGYQTILTFGGAYSNHIAATAAASKRFGFQSIGIIRGDELNTDSNSTLQKATSDGMVLHFVSRSEYQKRNDEEWVDLLKTEHQAFIIPEGGSNELAVKGVSELVDEIDKDFDLIVCPVGTGGTLAGIASGLKPHQKAIGISCLKGVSYLEDMVGDLASPNSEWELEHNYHFGGYAKFDPTLIAFINEFYTNTEIRLDPIYTGKMMYALFDLMKRGKFPNDKRIICVHTGGLQGIAGFNKQHDDIIKI